MMRTNLHPLALLVDAAAEKWVVVQDAPEHEREVVQADIPREFRIGDNDELTFHGLRFQLTISRLDGASSGQAQTYSVDVHEIVQNN